jgi:hypothetical protein
MTLFASHGIALPFLARGRWARAAGSSVLLLVLTACSGTIKPEQPGSEPKAVAEQPVTPQAPKPEPGEAPPSGEQADAPHAAAEPPAPAAPSQPAAVPAPSAPAPVPQTTVKPAAPAPVAPAPSAPPPITKKPATPPLPKSAPPAPPAPPATPAGEAGGKPASSVAKTPGPAPAPAPLDLKELKQELKDTKAIGIFSKITLKNQMDDLLGRLRKYHQGQANPPLTDLRRSYELLVMKVMSLVQDDDKKLASEIAASREAIWALLADPKKFATIDVS